MRSLNLYEELPAFKSHNEQSLGELLHGFLCYYARQFSFSDSCISVRLGDCIPRAAAMAHRSPKNTRQQWKFICIEGIVRFSVAGITGSPAVVTPANPRGGE